MAGTAPSSYGRLSRRTAAFSQLECIGLRKLVVVSGGSAECGSQTDVRMQELEQRVRNAAAAAAAAEAKEQADWERRAAEHRHRDDGGSSTEPRRSRPGANAFGAAFAPFFGPRLPTLESLPVGDVLQSVSTIFAEYLAESARTRLPPDNMVDFVCAHATRLSGKRGQARKFLASLLHSARGYAHEHPRLKMFAEAAGLLHAPFERPTSRLVLTTARILLGEGEALRRRFVLPIGQQQVHVLRETADAARLAAGALAQATSDQSEGSLEELLEALVGILPLHLRSMFKERIA